MERDELRENYAGVFDGRIGFGEKAAVLVVDFVRAYTTPGSPLHAPPVLEAVEATREVLTQARARGVPVVYTKVLYQPGAKDGGVFVRKVPVLQTFVPGEPLTEIVDDVAPAAEDVVLVKQYASAFFGTPLASMLTAQRVDTLIVTGCSTSGCIRATAVDGCQHGFRVIVPRQCVGDRVAAVHEANLFDIDSKYGDVVDRSEVLAWLRGGREG